MFAEWPQSFAFVFRLMFDASVRAVLAAAGVGLVLFATRARSGGVRHAAWCAVLAAMLLMPVLPRFMPSVAVPVSIPRSELEFPVVFAPVPPEDAVEGQVPTTGKMASAPLDAAHNAPVALAPGAKAVRWPLALLALYVTGVLLLAARLVAGWIAMRRVARESVPVAVQGELGLPANPTISESSLLSTPVTVGILRSRILLPSAWHSWPRQKLVAVLAHELAHTRRHDTLVAFAARVNVCLFWFHPLAWWLEKRLAADAEHACDDEGARAIGETRRYAEVLLDMAEAVRHAGGRTAWQGVGVHGSGLLGQRIDRILRGDLIREVSMTRKLVVAIGSATAILVVVACHQQPAPLKPDPKSVEQVAKRKADSDLYEAARAMNGEQARALHAAWRQNPEDMTAARKLLLFYEPYMVEAPGEKGKWVARCTLVIPEADCIAGRREVIAWVVEHHPESELAGGLPAHISPAPPDSLPDPAGYEQVKRLWLSGADGGNANAVALQNAAQFFWAADKPLAEQLLLRGRAKQPGMQWSRRLGSLYAVALVGSDASMPMGVVRSVNLADAHGPYAQQVRKTLEQTTDAELLTVAGAALIHETGQVADRLDFDPVALGKSYLERALQIDPQQPRARANLVWLRTRDRNIRLREFLKGVAPEKEREAVAKLPDAERFVYLPWLAETAFMRGDYLKNSRHDEAGMKAAWQDARGYAEDLLKLASVFRNDPNYGTAVFYGNTVLGLVTYREGGDTQVAMKCAIEASRAPATEELRYGSPFELRRLLTYLVRAGEREKVVECLDRLANMDALNANSLRQAADSIRRGVMPEYWDLMG